MMAPNLSAHALSSALGYRPSPYLLGQDHLPTRHIPIISVPDILEAFQQVHPSSSSTNLSNSIVRNTVGDPWELPELKWLDPADNPMTPSENFPDSLSSEKCSPDGERWPFSALYSGDRVAASSDDIPVQFALQSMINASSASSGSSVLVKSNRQVPSMNSASNPVSRDFSTSSVSQVPGWPRSHNTDNSICSHKRPAPFGRPDTDPNVENSNSDRLSFKFGARAHKSSVPERLISTDEISALTATPYRQENWSKQQQYANAASAAAVGTKNGSSIAHDQKMNTEKGVLSLTTTDQTAGTGQETKKPVATVSDHEIHIWTERERRKKMNGMFSTLHSLLPHLTSKADKSTIVDEAINYIQSLEVTMKGLLKRKCEVLSSDHSIMQSSLAALQASQNGSGVETEKLLAMPAMGFEGDVKLCARSHNSTPASSESHFQTLCSPNVVLNICGTDAFVTICSPRGRAGLLCRILFVMETHSLHVLNAHISTTEDTILYMIHAQNSELNKQLASGDMLNIALHDLTSCLTNLQC